MGRCKDMWMAEGERMEDAYVMGEIDRDEMVAFLQRHYQVRPASSDPDIDEIISALDEDRYGGPTDHLAQEGTL